LAVCKGGGEKKEKGGGKPEGRNNTYPRSLLALGKRGERLGEKEERRKKKRGKAGDEKSFLWPALDDPGEKRNLGRNKGGKRKGRA